MLSDNHLEELVKQYPIEIFYSAEDECYIANVPDLKYCSTHGETREEALDQVLIAIKAWIASALKQNEKLPKSTAKVIST